MLNSAASLQGCRLFRTFAPGYKIVVVHSAGHGQRPHPDAGLFLCPHQQERTGALIKGLGLYIHTCDIGGCLTEENASPRGESLSCNHGWRSRFSVPGSQTDWHGYKIVQYARKRNCSRQRGAALHLVRRQRHDTPRMVGSESEDPGSHSSSSSHHRPDDDGGVPGAGSSGLGAHGGGSRGADMALEPISRHGEYG